MKPNTSERSLEVITLTNPPHWVSFGYDGAIAGNFFTLHADRPTPESLGMSEIQSYGTEQFAGRLEEGTISAMSVRTFLKMLPDEASKVFCKDSVWPPALTTTKKTFIRRNHCLWCGASTETHIPGCKEDGLS